MSVYEPTATPFPRPLLTRRPRLEQMRRGLAASPRGDVVRLASGLAAVATTAMVTALELRRAR